MRLIDADALKADLRQYFTDGVLDGISARLAFNQILHDIDNAPTIDDLSEYSDKLWQKAYERGKSESITNEDIKSAIDEGFKNGYEMARHPEWYSECIVETSGRTYKGLSLKSIQGE